MTVGLKKTRASQKKDNQLVADLLALATLGQAALAGDCINGYECVRKVREVREALGLSQRPGTDVTGCPSTTKAPTAKARRLLAIVLL